MMTREALLALYDREQRREPEFPGARREDLGEVVRFVDEIPGSEANFVLYSRLTAANADRVIQEQIEYFAENGRSFEWKLFDHDTPSDLRDRLIAHGFTIGEVEAIMALDLTNTPVALLQPITADVRQLCDPGQIDIVVEVENAVWGGDQSSWGRRLAAELENAPDFLSIYVAYAENQPACAGWINFSPQSQFASLWGGSTRPEFRKRGFYTAVLAVRVQEAIRRGYRYLTIDASPMSRPIVARHGFQFLTYSYACTWSPDP